jgi:uncharacterized membrane protein
VRLLIAALAAVGCAVAAYLALFQLHRVAHVWDPVFHRGSEVVLQSAVSRAIRRWTLLPDSLLGAAAYAAEFVLSLLSVSSLGKSHRWPRILLEINSLALAAASLFLVVMQAFVIHAWCFLCLVSAGISVAIFIIIVEGRVR